MATHSSIPAWEIPWTGSLVGYSPWGHKRVRHDLAIKQLTQEQTDQLENSEIDTSICNIFI